MDYPAIVIGTSILILHIIKIFIKKDYENILYETKVNANKRFEINHSRWDLAKTIDIIY